jgi:DNA-directed RNA polymerase specialized sigma24 family protein
MGQKLNRADEAMITRTIWRIKPPSSIDWDDLRQEARIALWLKEDWPDDLDHNKRLRAMVARRAIIDYMRSQSWVSRDALKAGAIDDRFVSLDMLHELGGSPAEEEDRSVDPESYQAAVEIVERIREESKRDARFETIVTMVSAGHSYPEIGKVIGTSHVMVVHMMNKLRAIFAAEIKAAGDLKRNSLVGISQH